MSNNIDQYAKVKLGGGNEFMAKGPLEFMKWCSGFWGMPLVAFFPPGGTLLTSYLFTGTSPRRRANPRVTVHALGTASRNAGGVSRHPALLYTPTCRTVENDANRRLRRFASFSQRYKQLI